ncbi:hypothetical protein A6723_024265 [Pseudomonas sp. AU11447]|uniref:hypothetical protein n=1 Tax=unclassified Pseudomonas TaxID=196821 RepID=UPI0006D46533|nr:MULTISPECIES: hypothetical protein [unclassified Pseudomonas]OBY91174.1 hypothetical protein A6723_024265 [Pseudomonas sp. AU11447]
MTDHLRLVPKREPTEKEKLIQRLKNAPKPDGMLSCPECGGRSAVTVENGVFVKNGRRTKGTVIHRDICDVCRTLKGRIVKMRTGKEKPEIV